MGGNYKILILPDHPTPVSKMTHTSEPVPFLIYESSNEIKSSPEAKSANKPANNSLYGKIYDEFSAQETGLFIDTGHKLLDYFFKK